MAEQTEKAFLKQRKSRVDPPFLATFQVMIVAEELQPCDGEADLGGVDDMTKLTYLNEPGVLNNLRRRHALNEIYGLQLLILLQ